MRVVVFALIIERRILGVMCARFHERILFVGVLCATSGMPRFLSRARSVRSEIPTAKVQKKIDISDAKFSAAFFVAFGWANQSLDS